MRFLVAGAGSWGTAFTHVLRERGHDVVLACHTREQAEAINETGRNPRSLPKVDLVTAGFPCTDLSQAGRTQGIRGQQSGLVAEVFRLLRRPKAPMLLLENVRNMLVLDGGLVPGTTDGIPGAGRRHRVASPRWA